MHSAFRTASWRVSYDGRPSDWRAVSSSCWLLTRLAKKVERRSSALFRHAKQRRMKEEFMSTITKEQRKELRSLRDLRDRSIDTSDIAELKDWSGAAVGKFYRPIKEPVTIRLDADVLSWLKSQGAGYQTRINNLLRMAMLQSRNRRQR